MQEDPAGSASGCGTEGIYLTAGATPDFSTLRDLCFQFLTTASPVQGGVQPNTICFLNGSPPWTQQWYSATSCCTNKGVVLYWNKERCNIQAEIEKKHINVSSSSMIYIHLLLNLNFNKKNENTSTEAADNSFAPCGRSWHAGASLSRCKYSFVANKAQFSTVLCVQQSLHLPHPCLLDCLFGNGL